MRILYLKKDLGPFDLISNEEWENHLKSRRDMEKNIEDLYTAEGIKKIEKQLAKEGVKGDKTMKLRLKHYRNTAELNMYAPTIDRLRMHEWAEMDGAKPIHYAIIDNDRHLIRALAGQNPNVLNDKDVNNETPIDYAVRYNRFKYLPFLVKLGATEYNADRTIAKLQQFAKERNIFI
jgi:hypothetical protein